MHAADDQLAVVELIACTTVKTGLIERCKLDDCAYGIKVSDEEMTTLNIKGDAFQVRREAPSPPANPWCRSLR